MQNSQSGFGGASHSAQLLGAIASINNLNMTCKKLTIARNTECISKCLGTFADTAVENINILDN